MALPDLNGEPVASYFDVRTRTARRWMTSGSLGPFTRIGDRGRLVMLRESMLDHLRRQERTR